MKSGNSKVLYEISELLNLIPMSKSGLYLAIKKGYIPSKRIGSRLFVPSYYIEQLSSKISEI